MGGFSVGHYRITAGTIGTSAMSAPGDSGSLVTNLDEEGVGLLLASTSRVTLMNNLLFVQYLLRIRIHER